MTKLEQIFLDAWREHANGFPDPLHQYEIDGMKFDFAWPKSMLVVELEGFGWGHGTIAAKRRDAEKQRAATILGWRVLRFTSGCLGSRASRESAVHSVLYLLDEYAADGRAE